MPKPKRQITKIKNETQDEHNLIAANRYKVNNKLGSGSYGTVFLVTDLKAYKSEKVLKKIHIGDLEPNETISAVSEARLLSKLDHPGIVKFHDSFIDCEFFCIITEFCEGGDLDLKLQAWKKEGKSVDKSVVLTWFVQLVLAVQYIHQRRVLHRDLKTRNIFLRNNIVKIGDFGISRILAGSTDIATTFTGTPYYMAPEILKHEGYNSKSDIWSLGVIFFEMCTMKKAFRGNNLMTVMTSIVNGEIPKLPSKFNENIHCIYESMLCRDQKKRITATEILKNPFIAKYLEKLKVKLSAERTVDRTALNREAMEIADALAGGKYSKANQRPPPSFSNNNSNNQLKILNSRRPLTPKEKMKIRKQQRADQEIELLKKVTVQTYTENRRDCTDIKKRFEHTSADDTEQQQQCDIDENGVKRNTGEVYHHETPSPIQIGIIEATATTTASLDSFRLPRESSLDVYELPEDDNVFGNDNDDGGGAREDSERVRAYTHCFGEDETLCQARNYTHCFGEDSSGDEGGGAGTPRRSTTLKSHHTDNNNKRKTILEDSLSGSDNDSNDELTHVSTIPEDAEQADTFYSNYNDFESDDDDDDDYDDVTDPSSSTSSSVTSLSDVIGDGGGDAKTNLANRNQKDAKNEEENYVIEYENDVTVKSANRTDDYDALVGCMEHALELNEDDVQSTFGDSVSASSALSIRQEKIQNLRKECIKLLGEDGFNKVYSYLYEVRFNSKRTVNEDAIMRKLRRIVGSTRDCFLVEQLLFLEKQNEIYTETF